MVTRFRTISLSHYLTISLPHCLRKAPSSLFELDGCRGEAVKLGRAMLAAFKIASSLFEHIGGQDFAAEVAFVQLLVQHRLVDRLQLAERERIGQQKETKRSVFQLPAQPLEGVGTMRSWSKASSGRSYIDHHRASAASSPPRTW